MRYVCGQRNDTLIEPLRVEFVSRIFLFDGFRHDISLFVKIVCGEKAFCPSIRFYPRTMTQNHLLNCISFVISHGACTIILARMSAYLP